jgi:HD superfamily phosphohydrolase YqeK
MRDFPLRAWVFTALVALGSVWTIVFLTLGAGHAHIGAALGFGVLFLLAELAPFNTPNASYSVSFVITVAALVVAGPAEAAIAASFGALDLSVRKRPDWLGRMIFNGAQLSCATALAGAAYRAAGGPVGHLGAAEMPKVFLPLFAASIVYFVVNTGLVSQMVSLVRRVPIREVWHANYAPVAASTFAFAVLGIVLGALYLQMGSAALLFALVPLLVARRALEAAAKMDAAYEATLLALVAAIEAKDAYTRGHAERVSRLATMIARELKLSEKRIRALRIAALMHDVGKLVVSTAILQKPGKLTEEEYEHMKAHPLHGCEVIEEIDFLRDGEAVNAVRHHHERLDGRGYPDNLFGDDVPLTARIVMVADAFDSMTSTRTYRMAKGVEDGMRELRRCATTQFDPVCINALDRAIQRHGWEPTPELYGGEQTARPTVDVHAGNA